MRLPVVLVVVSLVLAALLSHALPLSLSAGDGTILVGAVVEVEKLDGTLLKVKVGPEGVVRVTEVPLGVLKVRVVSWKGVPINYECVVTPRNASVRVPNIYSLTVRVTGSRGQGIGGARVRILYGKLVVEEGLTNEAGVYVTSLPRAEYAIVVEYSGRRAETSIELVKAYEERVVLDVFVEIAGWALSPVELMGLIALTIVMILMIYVLLYEYSVWRRRRMVAVTVARRQR